MPKLTIPKREAFAQHYALHGNGAAAYRHAYSTDKMSETTLYSSASKLLDDPKVAARIQELKEIAAKRADEDHGVNASYVIRRLKEMDELDVLDILDDDGHPLPLRSWPKAWRTSVSGIDLETVTKLIPGKDDQALRTVLRKLKLPDKLKTLEMIGRHVDVQAWKDRVEHEAGGSLQELLEKARQERAG